MTNEDKLEKLIQLCERQIKAGVGPQKETRWFIARATAYLNGEYETIDQALGLEQNDQTH